MLLLNLYNMDFRIQDGIIISAILAALTSTGYSLEDSRWIHCPLEWALVKPDGTLPPSAISTYSDKHYVARGNLSSGETVIGRLDVDLNKCLLPSSTSTENAFTFELLTNPNKCSLQWANSVEKPTEVAKFAVSFDSNEYIGRSFNEGVSIAGSINLVKGVIKIVFNESLSLEKPVREAEFLISFSPGFRMELTNMDFDTDPTTAGQMEFVGMDVVDNDGETEVSYTVSHRKEHKGRVTLTETETCSSSWLVGVDLSIKVLGLGGGVKGGGSNDGIFVKSKSVSTETSESIELSQTVTVMPHQKVEICSSIKVTPPDFRNTFRAQALYRAAGWSGEMVAEYLRTQLNWAGVDVVGDAAWRNVSGILTGGTSVSGFTKVIPAGSSDGGCFEVKNTMAARSRSAFLKSRKNRIRRASLPQPKVSLDPISSRDITITLYSSKVQGHRLVVGDYSTLSPAKFDSGKMIIMTHGFNSNVGEFTNHATEILRRMPGTNVILVDWSKHANPLDIKIAYPLASANTLIVGALTAHLLLVLQELKVVESLDDVHMIGHSLGAHVSGFVGSSLMGKLGRITALDPAGPIFDTVCDGTRVDPSDAKFVVAIHTDGGVELGGLGFLEPRGHVDFYPNGGEDQPGCPPCEIPVICNIFPDFGISPCSHSRAVELLYHSLQPSVNFKGQMCSDYSSYLDGKCSDNELAVFDFNTPTATPHGSYFFKTTGVKPYVLP